MPVLPAPTIPYPSASGAQACADWTASSLAALRSRAAAALPVINTWLMQRQWIEDGGNLASYPLPVASGPAVALNLQGTASGAAGISDIATVAFS